MKFLYLFVLIGIIAVRANARIQLEGRSELNSEQGIFIDCSITEQNKESAVLNKADGLIADTAYYLGIFAYEVTPMAVNDQYVTPVHKHGIRGRDPVPIYINDSLSYRQGKPKGCYS